MKTDGENQQEDAPVVIVDVEDRWVRQRIADVCALIGMRSVGAECVARYEGAVAFVCDGSESERESDGAQAEGHAGMSGTGSVQLWTRAEIPLPVDIPTIAVGPGGAVRLPGDEELLGEILLTTFQRSRLHGGGVPELIVGVAEWEAGSSGSALAFALASSMGAALVDISGSAVPVGASAEPYELGVCWADIDEGELAFSPDLLEMLPVRRGVRVLGGDVRSVVFGGDVRVHPAVEALRASGPVVIDVGRWDDRAALAIGEIGPGASVCLAGRGCDESALRLAGSIDVHPCVAPVVLAHLRAVPSALLGEVLGEQRMRRYLWRFREGTVRRPGRRCSRRLRRLERLLRGAEEGRWLAQWQG